MSRYQTQQARAERDWIVLFLVGVGVKPRSIAGHLGLQRESIAAVLRRARGRAYIRLSSEAQAVAHELMAPERDYFLARATEP